MIYMLSGITGSGKSSYSKKLKKELNCEVLSTDELRNIHPDWSEDLIWPEVYRLLSEALKNNIDIIYDATNITPKVRNRIITEVEKHNVKAVVGVYFFDTSWKVCQKRVIKRNQIPGERYLPPEVVESYGKRVIKPTLDEGFVFIKTVKGGKIIEEVYSNVNC